MNRRWPRYRGKLAEFAPEPPAPLAQARRLRLLGAGLPACHLGVGGDADGVGVAGSDRGALMGGVRLRQVGGGVLAGAVVLEATIKECDQC